MSNEGKWTTGDFAIVKDAFTLWCGKIVRTTTQTVFFSGETYPRQARENQIVFSGPEAITKRLYEQLKSSRSAQYDDDAKARARRKKRDDGFLAKARAALTKAGAQ